MKILWVTNQIVGELAEKKGIINTTAQWLNAEIENEELQPGRELVICTTGGEGAELVSNNITYIVFPQGNIYNHKPSPENVNKWKEILKNIQPDIIIIWGTEYGLGLSVLLANENRIRSAIYIQGVMQSIYQNYRGGMTKKEIKKNTSILEMIRHTTIYDIENDYRKRAETEKQMVELCDYLILENEWSEKIYRSINSNVKILRSRLPIRGEFSQISWESGKYIQHQIITTAAGYPLKGVHILIQALAIVKDHYPDTKLIIPGVNMFQVDHIRNRIRQKTYHRYVGKLIDKYHLINNIKFVGPLEPKYYARMMAESELFVCCSAIENHSSTLREAMTVGVPCIATNVGGIPEFGMDGQNCLLYEFSDIKELAQKILYLFNHHDVEKKISENGRNTVDYLYNVDPLLNMEQVYNNILNN